MPIIKSAIKRVRQTKRRTDRNTIRKRQFRAVIKEFVELIEEKKFDEAAKLLPLAQKSIDLAVKNNLLHANTAGRKKSQLAKMLPQKKVAAKPAAEKKEAAPKKAPAKKPAAKKEA